MISQGLIAAIDRLARSMQRNPLVIDVEQELKAALVLQANKPLDKANNAPFCKKTYQRELMRKRRAAEKVLKPPRPIPT